MSEEKLIREVLDYLDHQCLNMEMLEQMNSFKNIQIVDQLVNEYEEKLREEYAPTLKRSLWEK